MKITTFFKEQEYLDKPELELRFRQPKAGDKALHSAEDMANYLRPLFDEGTFDVQEEMILLALDVLDRPIFFYSLASGLKNSVEYDPRMIMQVLLCTSTDRFVLAHNHPHGLEIASIEDVKSAHTLHIMSQLFGIELVDSIVLTREDYYSLAEEGLLWD